MGALVHVRSHVLVSSLKLMGALVHVHSYVLVSSPKAGCKIDLIYKVILHAGLRNHAFVKRLLTELFELNVFFILCLT